MNAELESLFDLIRSVAYANKYNGFISDKQLIMVNKGLDKSFPERSDRINFLRKCFKRDNIRSSKDLSKAEASALISYIYVDNWMISPNWLDMMEVFSKEQ